jgi:PIN domain nuclease of toxin-antitoxin system
MADDPTTPGLRAVLDASALLAYLQRERGHLLVGPVLETAVMSAVNLSEVLQKSAAAGVSTEGLLADLQAVGLRVHAFDCDDAACAADLWATTRKLGLSLGDRACLALAKRLHLPAYTADRAWAAIQVPGVVVRTVR